MIPNYKGVLSKGILVDEKYSVLLFKQGSNAETHSVKGKDAKLYFLELFQLCKAEPFGKLRAD